MSLYDHLREFRYRVIVSGGLHGRDEAVVS